jgi:hypothetical protein
LGQFGVLDDIKYYLILKNYWRVQFKWAHIALSALFQAVRVESSDDILVILVF